MCSLPRDSLALIPRGTGVPFKASFDSSRVVAAAVFTISSGALRLYLVRCFDFVQAAMPPSKKSLFNTLVGT